MTSTLLTRPRFVYTINDWSTIRNFCVLEVRSRIWLLALSVLVIWITVFYVMLLWSLFAVGTYSYLKHLKLAGPRRLRVKSLSLKVQPLLISLVIAVWCVCAWRAVTGEHWQIRHNRRTGFDLANRRELPKAGRRDAGVVSAASRRRESGMSAVPLLPADARLRN